MFSQIKIKLLVIYENNLIQQKIKGCSKIKITIFLFLRVTQPYVLQKHLKSQKELLEN